MTDLTGEQSAEGNQPLRPASAPPLETPPTANASPAATPDAPAPPDAPPTARFPVVGIGASAGGLAAFEAFFGALSTRTAPGIAIVLVQHLAPDHKSMLSDLIRRATNLPVFEIEDGMVLQPNCVYIIPPNRRLTLHQNTLRLSEPPEQHGMRLPIDAFFQSLAEDQHEYAISIVLSGTGSDGALGVRAVKAAGGMVIAQDPNSAAYDGMPRSAIATGIVDHVLPPTAIPDRVLAYTAQTYKRPDAAALAPPHPAERSASVADTLANICVVLRAQTGRDFAQYKTNTLIRRIERRMGLHQITHAADYLEYLQRQPAEIESLFHDLLIGVTSFFRDPEAFVLLQTQIIPRLLSRIRNDQPVRVWVCGCSTGEEAYSLAILFQEQIAALKEPVRVQIFATDLDVHAVDQARSGIFPASIAANVSPERLARWFIDEPESARYRINKTIRDCMIFSVQDVISDPPFSRLDFISCRNLLIYLNADLQKKLIPLFHYALRPNGVLLLGSSETIGEFTTLFSALDRTWKIYARQAELAGNPPAMPSPAHAMPNAVLTRAPQAHKAHPPADERNLRTLTEQALLAHFTPVGILVTERGEIVHIVGRTGQYLEPATGDAALNILAMAREGLRRELTIALHKAVAQAEPLHYRGLSVKTNGSFTLVNLTVRPLWPAANERTKPNLFLVILEAVPAEPTALPPPNCAETQPKSAAETDRRIAVLEQELRAKEEYLQTTLEEMETANEELQSANEELQSVNEELQSTNEELETSKEELQSVNEELATVNAELRHKVGDMMQVNNDMNNLLAGTGIGTLFIDFELRIARFTPAITQVINLIQTDVGRPVSDIGSKLVAYDRLAEDVQEVLDSLVPHETEVQARTGAWYQLRIRPYRTLENVIIGAVITFVDITQLKATEAALHKSEARFAKAFHTSRDGLAICRQRDGLVLDVNPSWEELAGYLRQEAQGRSLETLAFVEPEAWKQILAVFAADGFVRKRAITLRNRNGVRHAALVSVELLDNDQDPGLLVAFQLQADPSEQGRQQAQLQK